MVVMLCLAWLITGLGFAWGNTAAVGVERLPFTTLSQGHRSGIQNPERLVIRTALDWQRLWERHTAPLHPKPPLPTVNFSQEMVIAIFRGDTEGPFPVDIQQINRQGEDISVHYMMFSPPDGLPLMVALRLQPYHIVKLPHSPGSVTFERLSTQKLRNKHAVGRTE